jgi:hypothetical protein
MRMYSLDDSMVDQAPISMRALESFAEDLRLVPLPDGKVAAHFTFNTTQIARRGSFPSALLVPRPVRLQLPG